MAGARATRAIWGVSIEQDFSTIYAAPPQGAQAMFFVGEPVQFRVVIINDMPAPLSFSARQQAPGRLVHSGGWIEEHDRHRVSPDRRSLRPRRCQL